MSAHAQVVPPGALEQLDHLVGSYSHTENEFTARTDVGRAVLARFDEVLVNWDADLLTIVPGLEGRYAGASGR